MTRKRHAIYRQVVQFVHNSCGNRGANCHGLCQGRKTERLSEPA